MNNIEEMINHIKSEIASDNLCGHDELTVSVSDLSALIAQLEAAQGELSAANERIDELEINQVEQNDANSVLSAALDAANEKLSKPVVLPDYRCSPDMHTKQYYETIGFNLGLDACKAVIKTAGGKVEGE
ncbi:TPA: hypothetical protein ACPZO0_001702 [Yersinia enterocolitica]